MIIKSANYVSSFMKEEDIPSGDLPEFAFIGRSNVGKSSLINMLCNRKDLVKVSHTPGKTRMINFFLINEQFHFVDLPGYGFAKVSQQQRQSFEDMIFQYLGKREQLLCVFVLIDSRLEPQKLDLDFVNQLGERQIPFVIVFTKADKQGNSLTSRHVALFENEMMKSWEVLPQLIITSAVTRRGKDELLNFIEPLVSKA
jgi:GTP-binding protein